MRIIGALIVATMFGGAPSKAEPPQPVFPSGVSPKYANEPDEPARMHTCLDQYNVNKPNNANGGLNWIERGGGYYSECNQRLRAAGAQQQISPAPKIAPPNTASNKVFSTGTGFFVSENGHIVTNAHVVDGCQVVRSSRGGSLRKISKDDESDLALYLASERPDAIARLHGGRGARAGESVVAVGFPLRSLLSSDPIVSTGTISALSGLRNNRRTIQITAPVCNRVTAVVHC